MPTRDRAKPQPTAPFTAREERLAALLAAGWTVKAAAAEAGISERQAHAWRASKPGFNELVEGIRTEMLSGAVGRLAQLTTKAVDALEHVLDDKDAPAAVRVAAARGVLADAISLRASVDQARQIAELERALAVRSEGEKRR